MKSEEDQYSLTLQGLAKQGRQWDETVPLKLLADTSFGDMDTDSPLFGDMQWQGSLEPQDGQFVLSGAWHMQVPRRCGRCNMLFSQPMQSEVYVVYMLGKPEKKPGKEEELSADDCMVELLEAPGKLNMLDVLREQFWLAWQPMAVCSEECKGLCLQCGTNLNEEQCVCSSEARDNPFAALKNLKFDA